MLVIHVSGIHEREQYNRAMHEAQLAKLALRHSSAR